MKRIVTGLRLLLAGWTLCALIAMVATASAQEKLDANWIVGKWQGNIQFRQGLRPAPIEFLLKADGTFEGEAQAANLGAVTLQDGKWEISGDAVTFKYRTEANTPGGRSVSNSTWTLMRKGEDLEGTGVNHTTSLQFSATLKRAK